MIHSFSEGGVRRSFQRRLVLILWEPHHNHELPDEQHRHRGRIRTFSCSKITWNQNFDIFENTV